MKYFLAIFLSFFIMTGVAFADPRMEATDNFCHFILDGNDTDSEIFWPGCNSPITAYEGNASAYVLRTMYNSKQIATDIPGEGKRSFVFYGTDSQEYATMVSNMQDDFGSTCERKSCRSDLNGDRIVNALDIGILKSFVSDTACTLVETNGTAYTTNDWMSSVVVKHNHRATLELICRNGQQ